MYIVNQRQNNKIALASVGSWVCQEASSKLNEKNDYYSVLALFN